MLPTKTMITTCPPVKVSPAEPKSIIKWPGSLSKPQQALVLDCARMSWLAYSDAATVQNWYSKPPKIDLKRPTASDVMPRVLSAPRHETYAPCDAQCYLISYQPPKHAGLDGKRVLVLAVRGTKSFEDWICDGNCHDAVS
jgi:hypothetical protein